MGMFGTYTFHFFFYVRSVFSLSRLIQRIWQNFILSQVKKGLMHYLRFYSSSGSWLGPRLGRAPQLAAQAGERAHEKDQ